MFAATRLNMLLTLKYSTSDELFGYYFSKDMGGTFGPEDGFRLAAAITKFDGDPEPIEDEEVGVIRFVIKSWTGPLDSVVFTELPMRRCTEIDFQDHFSPLHPTME